MTAPFGPPCVPREMVDVRVLRDGRRDVPEWVPERELGGAAGPPSAQGPEASRASLPHRPSPSTAGVPSPFPLASKAK